LSGLSTLFTWLSICLCHIRFRKAWAVQGHSVEELPFKALGGVYGSWFGVFLIVIVFIAQFYIAVWPIGGMDPDPAIVAETFFGMPVVRLLFSFLRSLTWLSEIYLAFPVMILFYIVGYIWKRTLPQRAHEIDIDTGRKSWLTVEEMKQVRPHRLFLYRPSAHPFPFLVPCRTQGCSSSRPYIPHTFY
jgi:amino acid transporter